MKTAERDSSLYSGEQPFDRPKKYSGTLKTDNCADTGQTSGVSLMLAIESLERTAVRIFG